MKDKNSNLKFLLSLKDDYDIIQLLRSLFI